MATLSKSYDLVYAYVVSCTAGVEVCKLFSALFPAVRKNTHARKREEKKKTLYKLIIFDKSVRKVN